MKEAECYPGKRVGRLTLLSRKRVKSTNGRTQGGWLCRCDCGTEKVIRTYAIGLKRGQTQSCGCLARDLLVKRNAEVGDGDSVKGSKYHRLYTAWANMKSRCYASYNIDYANYGGRGIRVCDTWKNDYRSFKAWALENGFDPNKNGIEQSIDRIDVNGNYDPTNCRWVDIDVQSHNKTTNTYVFYHGKRYTLVELANKLHMDHKTLSYRINHGWSEEEIVGKPYSNNKGLIQVYATVNGKTKSLVEWSKIMGININTLRSRYDRGLREQELLAPINEEMSNRRKGVLV